MRYGHRFVKTKLFKNIVTELGAWEEVDVLKSVLDREPTAGKMIIGGNGLRKIRVALPGRGKSGGARVICYQVVDKKVIVLLFAYAKSVIDDLSPVRLKALVRLRDEAVKVLRGETDENH